MSNTLLSAHRMNLRRLPPAHPNILLFIIIFLFSQLYNVQYNVEQRMWKEIHVRIYGRRKERKRKKKDVSSRASDLTFYGGYWWSVHVSTTNGKDMEGGLRVKTHECRKHLLRFIFVILVVFIFVLRFYILCVLDTVSTTGKWNYIKMGLLFLYITEVIGLYVYTSDETGRQRVGGANVVHQLHRLWCPRFFRCFPFKK